MQYAAAGDWLVPCWWQHGFAVNELIALRTAWLGVKPSDEPSAALDWHEAAEKCRVRIHTVDWRWAGLHTRRALSRTTSHRGSPLD